MVLIRENNDYTVVTVDQDLLQSRVNSVIEAMNTDTTKYISYMNEFLSREIAIRIVVDEIIKTERYENTDKNIKNYMVYIGPTVYYMFIGVNSVEQLGEVGKIIYGVTSTRFLNSDINTPDENKTTTDG